MFFRFALLNPVPVAENSNRVDGTRVAQLREVPPSMKSMCTLASAVSLAALLSGQSAVARTTTVPAGGDLQAALTNAQPGDVILLEAGATFSGNFTLPAKEGTSFITLRTASQTDAVPDGTRLSPERASQLAKLRSPNNQPALQTAPGAHHWRILLLEFQANAGGVGEILALGSGSNAQTSLASVPHDLVVDRCYIHGDPAVGQKRCVALNSAATTISNSYIADCKAKGQDAQAIGGWNGPGPFTIANNYLEGSGENVMFGGADPSIPNLVPTGITVTGNTMSKPAAWRTQGWTVKNIFELKNARRVTISGNVFEYNWEGGQAGFSILFTPRNQDGSCPWCELSDITFENNVVQHVAAGISIMGFDDEHPSKQSRSITIRNNLFAHIDNQRWGGNGYFLQLLTGTRDITVDHNTIIHDHGSGIVVMEGPQILGFHFTNNIVQHNDYGFFGSNHSPGADSISAYLPASDITHNVLAGCDPARYPSGNTCPSLAQFKAQFVSYEEGDYRLKTTSSWRKAATDGGTLGADFSLVPRAPAERLPKPNAKER